MSVLAGDFRQRFALQRFVSVDARGDKTHGPLEANVPCRYLPSTRLLRDATGSQQVSTCVLLTDAAVTVEDLVWPPGADPSDEDASRVPIRVDTHYDMETGAVDHYEVHL